MKPIAELLKRKRVLLSDGAWGTMLQAKGLAAGECPELWNLQRRSEVLEIARAYVDSGCDLIETNSFGGNRIKLAHYGLEKRVRELNRAAAEISREAAGADRIVLGSIGPTGKMLLMGDVTEEELYDSFLEQAAALKDGGADAICIETMSAIDEARIAVRAAKDATGLEIICTFTFAKTPRGEYRTIMGHSVADVAAAMKQEGIDVIGANCGTGIEDMIEIVRGLRLVQKSLPIIAQPNAGMPAIDESGVVTYPEIPQFMASRAKALADAGARIIGGCCGTTPQHIRAIASALDCLDAD